MDDKEIWQLLDSSNLGGIESHVMELTAALCRKGLNTRIVFLKNHGEHPILPLLREKKLPYKILKGSSINLIRALTLRRPKLMHTHGYKAGIIGRLAGIITNIPVISTFHSGEPGIGKVRFYNRLDRKTAFLAREIIAVNTQIATYLPDRTRVINNFVEVVGQSRKLVKKPAFVGRLSYEKGPDLFCKLANLIPIEQFTIYGDGPMKNELKNIYQTVEFAGQKISMSNHWQEIGILCITSRHEGLPLAALEAMSHGIPVLAFAVGGLTTLIDQGRNGWTVKPGDISEFAQKLKHWNKLNSVQIQRMSDNAIKTVKARFSSQAVIPEFIQLYESAVSNKLT